MSPAVMCMTEGRMTEGRVARFERLLAAGDPVAVIVAIVARHSVGLRALLSPRRPRSSAIARHVCWHLARRHTCRSLPEIGAVFGVDHSSVLYGIRRVAHWRAAYPDVGAWADDAEREILRVLAAGSTAPAEQVGLA